MKICLCGKGGSGKSTITALLAGTFNRSGKQVFVLDSDESNSSLFWMLGFEQPPQPLMDLVGGKKSVQKKMIAKFSAGESEPAMSIWEKAGIATHDIPSGFVVRKNGVALAATGKIHQAMEGCACPMGTVTREFLKKLQPASDEIVLVDMEAGVEHFGRGVETGVDLVIGVVEPSLESISLGAKVMALTQTSGARFQGVILNKITSGEQKNLMETKLDELGVPVIGVMEHHGHIQSVCLEGKPLDARPYAIELEKLISFFQQKPLTRLS